MKYTVLATDYDGTLAHHGAVDTPTLQSLQRAKAAGLRLMLVTGRRLMDFPAIFPEWMLFDRIVAENGAELYNPSTEESRLLSSPPPKEMLKWLERQRIPLLVGKSVVATVKPHDQALAQVIADLRLDWHLIYNNHDVMALPSGVSKASGVLAGLVDLQIPVEECAAIGDAENDIELLNTAGFAVAVDNALPSVKAAAKWVTPGARGAGVAQLIERLLKQ